MGPKHRRNITFGYREEHEPNESSPTFFASLCINGVQLSEGRGYSKKEAEQNASMIMLSNEEALVMWGQQVIEDPCSKSEERVTSS